MARRRIASTAELERIATELEGWRRSAERGREIPEEIWRGVVALAREHGVHRVARSLGLNYDSVKRRAAGCVGVSKKEAEVAAFLDLGHATLGRRNGCVVELSAPDGVRLTVKGASSEEISALVASVLSRGR